MPIQTYPVPVKTRQPAGKYWTTSGFQLILIPSFSVHIHYNYRWLSHDFELRRLKPSMIFEILIAVIPQSHHHLQELDLLARSDPRVRRTRLSISSNGRPLSLLPSGL
jgi:hypothetical protein